MQTVKKFWYHASYNLDIHVQQSNIDMMQGRCEGLILIELNENTIKTIIYGNGRFGYSPYYIVREE